MIVCLVILMLVLKLIFLGQQVDLHTLKVLTGIATQGAISKETQKSYYVTAFKLEVSTNGEDWMVYRHVRNHKVTSGACIHLERLHMDTYSCHGKGCKVVRATGESLDVLR